MHSPHSFPCPGAPTPGRWLDHLPESSVALSALLHRAEHGGGGFSPPERVLFMACEFWVAVEQRVLPAYLQVNTADTLRYQGIIYAALGAHRVARALVDGLRELGGAASVASRGRCLDSLQARLAMTDDPVDRLIAQLAGRLGLSATDGDALQERAARPAAAVGSRSGR